MAFYATTFIFDDIPGEFYNLFLGEPDSSGQSVTSASSDVSLLTNKIFRRPVPLFYGTEQTPVLTFQMSVYCESEIGADDFSKISSWLFGQQEYKKLRICQSDMQGVYFNCFLTSPSIMRIGNKIHGFTFTVTCDAPWGWGEAESHSFTYSVANVNSTEIIYNSSANSFYTYPTNLVLTANNTGGSIAITNVTDNNRQFVLSVSPSEVVTINNDLQIISSTIETYPIQNFNLHWMRLLSGYNNLTISGNVSSVVFSYAPAIKIGG